MNNQSLLVVDDEPGVVNSLKRELRHEGYTIYSANSGKAGLDVLEGNDICVVVSGQMMPEMDGVTFLESVKQYSSDVVRILLTGHGTLENAMDASNRSDIFAYLTKPWSSEALKGTLASAFEHYNLTIENRRLQRLTREQNERLKLMNEDLGNLVKKRTLQIREAVREGIVILAKAAEAKDDDTQEHVLRVGGLTRHICEGLGMSSKESKKISFFSLMHDIGKIYTPDKILKKRTPLTIEEWTVMQMHCTIGEKILGNKPFYKTAREIARSHHERWDGSGYPDGLKGQDIPLSARIVTVADVFDVLTHERPSKSAWTEEDAIEEMVTQSGKAFDPNVLETFLNLRTQGEPGGPHE